MTSIADIPPELETVFQECLERFPELKNKDIHLKVVKTINTLEAAKAIDKIGKDIVIVWIPTQLWGLWDAIRPMIYHELSHFINLHNPDKIFYERADKRSQTLWALLQKAKAVKCES